MFCETNCLYNHHIIKPCNLSLQSDEAKYMVHTVILIRNGVHNVHTLRSQTFGTKCPHALTLLSLNFFGTKKMLWKYHMAPNDNGP